MLYSSVYNIFALIGRKAPITHSLTLTYVYSKKKHLSEHHQNLISTKLQCSVRDIETKTERDRSANLSQVKVKWCDPVLNKIESHGSA